MNNFIKVNKRNGGNARKPENRELGFDFLHNYSTFDSLDNRYPRGWPLK